VKFLRIQFVENYEQYKKGEGHTIRDGLAQRLLEQGKARLPTQADQKITILEITQPSQVSVKESGKAPRKKKPESKK
jgi:hypothetical protein